MVTMDSLDNIYLQWHSNLMTLLSSISTNVIVTQLLLKDAPIRNEIQGYNFSIIELKEYEIVTEGIAEGLFNIKDLSKKNTLINLLHVSAKKFETYLKEIRRDDEYLVEFFDELMEAYLSGEAEELRKVLETYLYIIRQKEELVHQVYDYIDKIIENIEFLSK